MDFPCLHTVMAAEIRQEHDLPFPVERVWKALTDADELAKWSTTTDFKPVVGHRYHNYDTPNEHWDGIMRGEVLEVDAPRRLVATWESGGEGPHRVEWTLTPTENGTRLRLRHSGFAPDWPMRAMIEDGYSVLLGRLEGLLATGEPQRSRHEPTAAQLGAV